MLLGVSSGLFALPSFLGWKNDLEEHRRGKKEMKTAPRTPPIHDVLYS